MSDNLERKIYEAIRGQCISDASAERAAALATELAGEKCTSADKQSMAIAQIAEQMEQWSDKNVFADVSLLRSRIADWARQLRAL